jgi:8-oxo-dGTP pyrophosphatase MutT (NUDIX family)
MTNSRQAAGNPPEGIEPERKKSNRNVVFVRILFYVLQCLCYTANHWCGIMPIKPWRLISSQRSESFKIFNLRTDRACSPRTNEAYDFYILESADWVNVIPLTPRNEVVLIRQYRHGLGEATLEIPGGIVEETDSPEHAASRELIEETGYKESEMHLLGSVHPNPAFLTNRCYTFVAKGVSLVKEQEQDEKEDIEVVVRPLEQIPALIREREITHALVLAAFYRFYMEYLPGL